jgi:hypothetical protein
LKVRKKLAFLVVLLLLVAGLVGLGGIAGSVMTKRAYRDRFEGAWRKGTMGQLLDKEKQKDASLAYFDPEAALEIMDSISWCAPQVPTPFVGHGSRPGQHKGVTINSLQFRSERELVVPKPKDVCRIFLTGGSVAYSSGAPRDEDTIGAYLEQLLNRERKPQTARRYEVYTCATPAWASTHERIFIENRLSELEPDLVISFSGVNDVHWALQGRNVLWFRTYGDELYWSVVDTVYRAFDQPPLVDVQDNAAHPVPPELVASRLEKNVRLAQTALHLEGAEYVFALQPNLYLTQKPLTPEEEKRRQRRKKHTDYFASCYREMQARLNSLKADGFRFVSMVEAFDRLDASAGVFLDLYHFGDRGNRIIAEQLLESVREALRE